MVLEKQSEEKNSEKNSRTEFIMITVILFIIMVISFSVIYSGTFYKILINANVIPLKYYLPITIIFIPMILSVVTLLIFIHTLEHQRKILRDVQNTISEISPFDNVMKELHNPTIQRTKRLKRTLWSLSIISVITILFSRNYIIIIVLKFL